MLYSDFSSLSAVEDLITSQQTWVRRLLCLPTAAFNFVIRMIVDIVIFLVSDLFNCSILAFWNPG